MTTGPITSWQIQEEDMEAVTDFTYLGSMITEDRDSSHEIKRHLLLGRKAMTNLDSILKSRDISLPTKVRIVKAMVFPVVMYGSESWTIKKADRRRIDAFELWCLRRFLRVPWAATYPFWRKSALSTHWKDRSWSWGSNTLAISWEMSLEKDPDVGKEWSQEEKGTTEDEMVRQCHRSDQHAFDPTPGGSRRQEGLACSDPWGHEELDTT